MRVFNHHVYEFEKGLRNLVLHTLPSGDEAEAVARLRARGIAFHVERVSETRVNVFFGDEECVAVVLRICRKPLHRLTLEEDFILGIMLGYGRLTQVKRYLKRRSLAVVR